MKDLVDIICGVWDHGTFFPVAERLARDYGEVWYHLPDGDSFKTFAKWCRGYGNTKVKFCEDFWRQKDDFDLVVFPDSTDVGEQLELERQGMPVWGSKAAGDLETMRGDWLDLCEELDMPMPRTERVKGLTNLRLFLSDNDDQEWFVKISRWRGDMETWKASDPEQIRSKCDLLALKFGPFQEEIMFYVQAKIDTPIESGADTYNVHGDYPDKVVLGYENKAKSYFATWKQLSEMPPEVWGPMDKIAPVLKRRLYGNFVSSEIRIKDGKSYWLDPCLRCPSPAGEEQLELYENFGEIVLNAAHGILTQPVMAAKFCGEAVISSTADQEGWKSIKIPEEIEDYVKLYASGYCDGAYHFGPAQDPDAIGCAVALGDTPQTIIDILKRIEEALKDEPVELHIEPLADLFKEIEEAEAQGIPFSEKEMPEPSAVMES